MNEGNGPHGSAEIYSRYAKSIDPSSETQAPTTIIISTDPVSAEMQAIKMMRLNKNPTGLFTVAAMPAYLKASAGVSGALTPTYNIGVIDESKMDVRRIINGVVVSTSLNGVNTAGAANRANLNIERITRGHVFIEYALPGNCVGRLSRLEISDARGAVVRALSGKVYGHRNHFSWDERNSHGKRVSTGIYFIRLSAGVVRLAGQVVVI